MAILDSWPQLGFDVGVEGLVVPHNIGCTGHHTLVGTVLTVGEGIIIKRR